MYVIQSNACDMPNSETPITADQIARQDQFVAAIGKKFTDGNLAMAQVIARLTPPPPVGSCDDFTSSASMSNATPFPWPFPGAAPGFPAASVGNGGAAGSPDPVPQVSGGWVWSNPGGGASYPWGDTQLRASRLIPPWACPGAGAPEGGLADGNFDTAMSWAKWLAIGLGVILLASSTKRGRRGD